MPSQAHMPGILKVNTAETCRLWIVHSSTPGISDPQLQLGSGPPAFCANTHTRLRTLVLLRKSPESSRNLHLQPSAPQRQRGLFGVLKSVVFKSYAGTVATSQPSGLPLPFPVPSKVSWLHKRAAPLWPPPPTLHTLLAQAPTRLPRRTHTRARTHSAHVRPFSTGARSQFTNSRSPA